MNKNLYRIVFNRTSGLFQVVAEIVRRNGPGGRAGATTTAHSRFLAVVNPVYFALAFVFGQAVIVPTVSAQLVVDPNAPGNQRPTVLEAANGVPLVNIQTPSAAGVSRNTYQQFDVDAQGAILNNSRTNAQTELGGWVQGNPWLAQGTARVILNEVNSNDPSLLRGYVEVAGDRAQLVIANPAGISCDGCGFINADRSTLTTGKPVMNGGSLDGYRVQGGSIWVHGKGLDASATHYTDLIARSVEVNAGIWAQQLQVTAGVNEVSADHTKVQHMAADGKAPAFALDVGALGGMYSQKIVLVGTEYGVGMRNAGTIGAHVGQLVVTANGRLENSGTIQARTDTHIQANDGFANTGTVSAGRELLLNSAKDMDNRRGTLNARRVAIKAQSLENQDGTIEQTGTQSLTLYAAQISNRDGGRIGLTVQSSSPGDGATPGAETDGGTGTAGGHPSQEGADLGDSGSTGADVAPVAEGRLDIAAKLDNTGGRIVAGGDINMVAKEGLNNDDGYLGVHLLEVSGGDLTNRKGEIKVAGKAQIAVGQFRNDTGLVQSAGQLDLGAQDLSNRGGQLIAAGNLSNHLDVAGTLDNREGGTLASNADLNIRAGVLMNTGGEILHTGGGRLDLDVATLHGQHGHIASNGRLKLQGKITDLRQATTQAQAIEIQTDTLNTAKGTLLASGSEMLALKAHDTIDNRDGIIAGNGGVDLRAGSFYNQGGTVSAAQTLNMIAQQELDNRGGKMVSVADVVLQAKTLDNRDGGTIVSTDGNLDAQTQDRTENAGGTLQGSSDVSLVNAGLGNADGTVLGSSVDIHTRGALLDNVGGTIASTGGRLNVDSGALINAGGLLQSAQAMRLDTHGQELINTGSGSAGGILSGDALTLNSGSVNNNEGVIYSQGDVSVELSGVANNTAGLMAAGNQLSLKATQILNRHTQSVDASHSLGMQGDRVTLSAGHIDNTDGAIVADHSLGVRGAGTASVLDNTRGQLSSGGRIELAAHRVLNSSGTVLAGQSLVLAADSLGGDGSLYSKGDLSLSVQQSFTNLTDIRANGHAVINTAEQLTNQGVIQAGTLELRGTNVNNTATGEISGGRTTVVASQTLTNRGLIDGGQTHIDVGTLDNAGTGRLYGDHLTIQADTVNNREEGDRAAVIAARERLDIGAKLINNREQALIFSAGGGSDALNIGGELDAEGHATGSANLVLNDSALIESLGGMTIDTSRLLNRNVHFSTELVQVGGPTQHTYIQPSGDPNKHDISDYRWESWSRAGRYRNKATGAEVQAWTQYELTRSEYETQVTESAPSMIRSGGNMTLRGKELLNDKSQIIAGGTLQGDLHNLTNEAVFGEHVTRETGTSQYSYSRWRGGFKRYHQRKWDSKIAYNPADIVQTFSLDISKVVENAAGGGSGFAIGDRQTGQAGGSVEVGGSVGHKQISEVQAEVPDAKGDTLARIRMVQVDTEVPTNSLLRVGPNASGYLVETDPRFTDYRQWLSSDYMLSQLGYDPTTLHKRLGDGFYEQKLVRDQISQLTGRRFLEGYANDEAQYRALLDAGTTYAKEWNLRPGVALSAAQMAQLTSDIVWLVERDITLADGSSTRALVPQVYVRVKPGDLDGRGTLMAANAIDLKLKDDLANSGSIAGRTVVKLTGENLRNLSGRITGGAVALNARADIDNIGGTLDANTTLLLNAGRDLNVVSTTHSDAKQAGKSDFSRTNLDRVAGLYVTDPDGILLASAGRDANLMAAQLINSGKDGQTAIVAGRDLSLGTVQIAEQENNVRNTSNYLKQGYARDVGTMIDAAGDIRVQAGRDLTAVAATVTSEQGAVVAAAQGDVNILAGQDSRNWSEGRQHKSRGFLSAKKATTRDSLEETKAASSTFSGNTVAVQGQNVTVTGSDIVSDTSTVIVAKHDLTIQAATESSSESHFKRTDKSGLMTDGGMSFTLGKQMQSVDQRDVSTHAAASTVGSTEGDVTLVAGNRYQQIGSHVLAPKGDIDIHAKRVDIVEARETGTSIQESKFRQSGLTVALTSPVVSAIQTGQQMQRASGNTSDTRMKALAAATTGLAAVNAYDAISADPTMGGGVNLSITAGSSKSDSQSTTTYDTATGSTVAAGGHVHISATGAGQDSDLTVRGSAIRAGGNAHLKADGDITLLAAENTVQTDRASSSSSAGVGVAISVGSNGVGLGVTANASRGKGKGEGKDVTWSNSYVTAGERLVLESGGDTTLRGAVVSGKQVVADVGGNLNIESLQDSSTFNSKDRHVGGSVMVGVTGLSGSVNVGKQSIHSDYASVREQSRIEAGDGGFQITVKGNTDLKGAVITSSQRAVNEGLNTLTTGTLTTSDIKNRAEYKASSVSLGGGYSSGGKDASQSGDGVGTDQQGHAATGGQVPGSTLPTSGNFSASPPIVLAASGKSSSTTHSGISGAQITITDEAKQQLLTGETLDERINSLNRDVLTGQDGSNALKPIFNEQEIQAGFEIVGALQRETGVLLNNMAKKADAKIREAKAAEARAADLGNGLTDAQRRTLRDQAAASYTEARNIDANWGAGGTYRQIAAALTAAAGGNVTGTTSQFAQNMLINYVQQQGAGYIGTLVADGTLTEGSTLHAALHAIVACSGAAASRQGCGSAALGAAGSSLLTGLFSETSPDEKATEREAKRNLIISIVTGIGAISSADAATAATAAASAVDNNWLATQQLVQMKKELAAADGLLEHLTISGKWAYLSGEQDVVSAAGVGKGLALAGWSDLHALADFLSDPVTGLKGLHALITDPDVRQQMGDALYAELNTKITRMQTALEVGGADQALQLGEDLGNLVWQVGTVATGVGGTAKAGVALSKAGIKVSTQGLEAFAGAAKFDRLLANGGLFAADGRPLMDFRQLTNSQKSIVGEVMGSEKVLQLMPDAQKIGRTPGIGATGIDDLYRVARADVDYVVVEYKFGSSTLKKTKDGLQMSDDWLLGTTSKYARIFESVGKDHAKAGEIMRSLRAGRVERWVVHTDPHGVVTVGIVDKMGKFIPNPEAASRILGALP